MFYTALKRMISGSKAVGESASEAGTHFPNHSCFLFTFLLVRFLQIPDAAFQIDNFKGFQERSAEIGHYATHPGLQLAGMKASHCFGKHFLHVLLVISRAGGRHRWALYCVSWQIAADRSSMNLK